MFCGMYKDSVKHISSFLVLSNFFLVVFDPYFSRVKTGGTKKRRSSPKLFLLQSSTMGPKKGKKGKKAQDEDWGDEDAKVEEKMKALMLDAEGGEEASAETAGPAKKGAKAKKKAKAAKAAAAAEEEEEDEPEVEDEDLQEDGEEEEARKKKSGKAAKKSKKKSPVDSQEEEEEDGAEKQDEEKPEEEDEEEEKTEKSEFDHCIS